MSVERGITRAEVRATGFSLLEAPRWRGDHLLVSDFFTERVLRFTDKGGELKPETICHVPGRPAGLGFTPAGNLWVVSMLEHRIYEWSTGRLCEVADLSEWMLGPANDMLIDAAGRAYVGNFGVPDNAHTPLCSTRLVKVEPNGFAKPVGDPVIFPNGMALSGDGFELLVAETYAGAVTAFAIAEDGELYDRRLWAQFGEPKEFNDLLLATDHFPVLPDGLAIDSVGALWVADAKGSGIARVAEGGAQLDYIETGDLSVYAAALGGPDLRTLYLCCAPAVETNNPVITRRSVLMSARVEVPGVEEFV